MRNSTLPKLVGGFYPVQLLVLILKRVPANAILICTVFLMAIHIGTAAGASVQNKDSEGRLLPNVSPNLELKIEPKVQITRDLFYADVKANDVNLQSLDIYYQDNRRLQPVVIYVHGGSWAFGDKKDVNFKPDFFASQGISFISMNYRLRWDYQLYDQLEDIASVVGWVKKNGDAFGLDADRIILMGQGAGAHLVSLVATDSSYLRARELDITDVRAVVAIDTLSFDIPRVMKELGSFIERRQHRLVFSSDDEVWKAASPIHHITDNGDIPGFAVMYSADKEANTLQARAFTKKLAKAGVDTIMIPGNSKTSESIDDELGQFSDTPTQALMAFIRAKI